MPDQQQAQQQAKEALKQTQPPDPRQLPAAAQTAPASPAGGQDYRSQADGHYWYQETLPA